MECNLTRDVSWIVPLVVALAVSLVGPALVRRRHLKSWRRGSLKLTAASCLYMNISLLYEILHLKH